MQKNRIIPILALLLLIGAPALAMGATSDINTRYDTDATSVELLASSTTLPAGTYDANVSNVTAFTGFSTADINVTLNNGQTKDVTAFINRDDFNIYNTLNSAYLVPKDVTVNLAKVRVRNDGFVNVITKVTYA